MTSTGPRHMTIGQLAARLRISSRTIRHYESLGLLVPEFIDPRTGYRAFGAEQLVRGLQIEQLKSVGLSLASIREVLAEPDATALADRRRAIVAELARGARQLRMVDAMLASSVRLAAPVVLVRPASNAVVVRTECAPDDLGRTIRRTVQRLRRDVRRHDGVACTSFSARFPLEVPDERVTVDIAGHVGTPTARSRALPAELALEVQLVGTVDLLPMAYDAALTSAVELRLDPAGEVVEHYLEISEPATTCVAILLRPPGPRQAPMQR